MRTISRYPMTLSKKRAERCDVEGRSDMPLEAGVESRSNMPLEAGAEGRSDMPQESGVKEVYGSSAKKEENEAIYREGEFDDLITVRGEDVVILYEGASQVRHVEAEFWMDQTPDLWKIFDQMRDEEDNWAKLASGKAEQLTDELMEAIRRGDVKTLYISLEPWGEGHNFIVEFADEWVEITYMDDEAPVYYNSYNPAYSNPADLSPTEFGGQSPIPKMLALEDMELAEEIVRHILATGQLLPGTLWKTGEV